MAFHTDIAEQLIPRFVKAGYLAPSRSVTPKGVYVVTFSAPRVVGDQAVLSLVDDVVIEFQGFANSLSNIKTYSQDKEYLTDVLVRFLVSLDIYQPESFSSEILKLSLDNELMAQLDEIEEGGQPLNKEDRYMAARFVQHICEARPELVPHLARLASIGLLTEVVEDFLHPVQRKQQIDLTIVVDAPLALDYLGCSGEVSKIDVRQIFDSLKQNGAKLIVFPVTLIEMQRNLQSMLNQKSTERHGPTHEAMLRREVSEDFVKAISNNPQKALENVGFQVRQLEIEHFPNLHKFFSEDRYEDFFSSIQWVSDVAPREHDATCMALTMRLREGRNSSDIFQSRYIFVTRNPRFVRYARNYCLQSRLINKVQEGPVIGQRELATIAWLRTGLGANDEAVPRGHLLATCDRVLRVRPEVRDAVVSRLKSYTPDKAEEMSLLLLDQKILRRLADETFNDETVITDDNADQLFEAVKQAALEKERERFDLALQAERSRSLQALADKELAESELKMVSDESRRRIHTIGRIVTQRTKNIEYLFLAFVFIMIFTGVSNYFADWLSDYAVFALLFAGALGAFTIYHQSMNFLGRQKFSVNNILECLARRQFIKLLTDLSLEQQIKIDLVEFTAGKVRISEGAFVKKTPQ